MSTADFDVREAWVTQLAWYLTGSFTGVDRGHLLGILRAHPHSFGAEVRYALQHDPLTPEQRADLIALLLEA